MTPEGENVAAEPVAPVEVVDAVFAIFCRCLPVDHGYALSEAIAGVLPWFAQEPGAGLHPVYGAASGGGWMRPEAADALLQLSHRARLALRLSRHRVADAKALLGHKLEVDGWPLRVDSISLRPLSRMTTLFSRGVVFDGADDEAAVLAAARGELDALGIQPQHMLCGRIAPVAAPGRTYHARSLLLAGLTPQNALALQTHGLGVARKLGCGLFIPHRGIAELGVRSD